MLFFEDGTDCTPALQCLMSLRLEFSCTHDKQGLAAWIVIGGLPRVSVSIASIPANKTFGSSRLMFRSDHNSGDDVFQLFRKFSAIRDTIQFHIGQRSRCVFKICRRIARTFRLKGVAVRRKDERKTTSK